MTSKKIVKWDLQASEKGHPAITGELGMLTKYSFVKRREVGDDPSVKEWELARKWMLRWEKEQEGRPSRSKEEPYKGRELWESNAHLQELQVIIIKVPGARWRQQALMQSWYAKESGLHFRGRGRTRFLNRVAKY